MVFSACTDFISKCKPETEKVGFYRVIYTFYSGLYRNEIQK